MKKVWKSRGGFTLIELLVVIAIISLLSSVVLSSLQNIRASARDQRRLEDLRQIVTALNLFYNDHDRWPTENAPDNASGGSTGRICPECSGNINDILAEYMQSIPVDPINDDTHHYYYDGRHNCGGHPNVALLLARTMETQSDNRDELKCSSYGGEGGTNSNNAHIIILGDSDG